ncbi:peptidase associated/transthyretin-like domain-containing protein [Sphingobacterium yanglingense]|uniref:Secretin/TonB short N-terminal domain-containing protein n=1 Tax=Sphingobacterium yanglingense TaxID=1437280 RepID=A0A4R6WLJ7_9SPHI|nr:hypothetical protein [Sphingobacterium yanglingense]TDQ79195.1 hypothetical protein CLV99_0627 [Sphingobacterium yanglingense]
MVKKTLSIATYCWTIMKWTTIIYTCIAVLLLSAKANESSGQVNFDSKVLLKEETISLKASLKKISKQTGVDFAYNNQFMPLSKSITWTKETNDLGEALDRLTQVFDLEYRVVGKTLLLLPKEEASQGIVPQQVEIKRYTDADKQEDVIEGIIFNAETKEPIEGATVELVRLRLRTQTDAKGHFRMAVPVGKGERR